MSKVIKQTGDFKPAKIIDKDFAKQPVWADLARREKPEITEIVHPQGKPDSHENSSIQKEAGSPQQGFDYDFSAPEPDKITPGDFSHDQSTQQTSTNPNLYTQEELDSVGEEQYNLGIQAGMERLESDYGLSVKTLQSVCEQLSTIRETILKNSMQEMANLVMIISEKIVRQSVASQKETITRTVEEAIQQAVKSEEFIVSVNPDDYAIIKEKSEDFIQSISGLENIVVKSDPTVECGGCIIESSTCTVDASLTSQLETIGKSIQE